MININKYKWLLIGLILSLLFLSCEDIERTNNIQNSINNDDYVEDEHGQRYHIIVIEGCEYYLYDEYRQMGLAKVDCDCIADKSGRND